MRVPSAGEGNWPKSTNFKQIVAIRHESAERSFSRFASVYGICQPARWVFFSLARTRSRYGKGNCGSDGSQSAEHSDPHSTTYMYIHTYASRQQYLRRICAPARRIAIQRGTLMLLVPPRALFARARTRVDRRESNMHKQRHFRAIQECARREIMQANVNRSALVQLSFCSPFSWFTDVPSNNRVWELRTWSSARQSKSSTEMFKFWEERNSIQFDANSPIMPPKHGASNAFTLQDEQTENRHPVQLFKLSCALSTQLRLIRRALQKTAPEYRA